MNFEIIINNVQHIDSLYFAANLSDSKIICIAGKNSVGKTTLIRAIRNLSINNTFQDTAAPYIFHNDSYIVYDIDDKKIEFTFNSKLSLIDTKQNIPQEIRDLFIVELPIPHGERFNQFRKLADLDEEIRGKIAIGNYSRPEELIEFLSRVYYDDRFDSLREVSIKGKKYYFILRDEKERYYIREDYFSSGEYFVLSLYRHIKSKNKFIVIDEIDISLDASAQVNLIKNLRDFCQINNVNIAFTTHSLALMKTLNPDEIFYMEYDPIIKMVSVDNRSYNFIKSVMYRFKGYDKYILTEDECLEEYMRYLISHSSEDIFFQYEIIYVAGGFQVIDLLERNSRLQFLTENNNVLAVLDGDQKEEKYHKKHENVLFLPFPSIEKEIYSQYENGNKAIPKVESIEGKSYSKKAKNLFWKLTKIHANKQLISKEKLYERLEELYPDEVKEFRDSLINFLK